MSESANSYESICRFLELEPCFDYDAKWAAAPDFLGLIIEHCLQHKPQSIVECSSGISSLVLARCCQLNGRGHVYSLENGDEFRQATVDQLQRYGLDAYADIIHAPLETVVTGGEEYLWYRLDELDAGAIDMMVIDGPPGFIQQRSRYPALPLLSKNCSQGCHIFLDDASRDDEREIVRRWQQEHPAMTMRFIDNERGCVVFEPAPGS